MNETYPQSIDFELQERVLSIWKSGELVGIPTETVYGLSADAESDLAVAKIYSMKSRPQFNPLIIHVANIEVAKKYAQWNPLAETLAQKFWPGPLTIVLPTVQPTVLSTLALAGGNTVALRAPSHPTFHVLLEKWGRGIAAPSANRSGRVSPTTAQHVRDEFGDMLYVVDGGACDVGIESTVVDATDENGVAILRKGIITSEQLAAVVPIIAAKDEVIKSPGMLLHHYAPSIPVRLNATRVEGDEALLAFGTDVPSGARTTLNLSPSGNLVEAAANLFGYLRILDHLPHKMIAVMPIPEQGIGEAINDRLKRAAQ
ncbi:MAG: threonylcarbamoyl-AMP synthase [Alphaproteobacteria bacterium]|nr:threonylcarbamoyl-AMP synthase [Alphaproteobacteria bacterium]